MDAVQSAAASLGLEVPVVEPSSPRRRQLYNRVWEIRFATPSKERKPGCNPKPNWKASKSACNPASTVDQLLKVTETASKAAPQRMNSAAGTNRARSSASFELPSAPVAAGFRPGVCRPMVSDGGFRCQASKQHQGCR
eukprot:TRINITY_DN8910_c0_g1_i2.p1 TRINITY_DN8910_c0_g1~~TRINITY_DN8910_c0_g1_i2.p1  ORF type:complete len:138 (+),score=21.63 TRINITY_DN8910_c0_g1_i2:231-644(+)